MRSDAFAALVLLGCVLLVVAGVYGLAFVAGLTRRPLRASAFVSGDAQREHAFSRFHVRWYTVALVFLVFDMEMLFMYPWTLVVAAVGSTAVIEMFVFLAILVAGVLYAWREGAFRWS